MSHNDNKSNSLFSYIKGIIDILEKYGIKKSTEINFPHQFLCNLIIERIYYNLNTVSICLEKNPNEHGQALGLIMRNIISDYMIIMFLHYKSKNLNEFIDNVYIMMYEDILVIDKLIEEEKAQGAITDDSYQKYLGLKQQELTLHNLVITNAQIIIKRNKEQKQSGNLHSNPLTVWPTTTTIFKYFINQRKELEEVRNIREAYHYWVIFSKYEHLGINSYMYSREIKNASYLDWAKITTKISVITIIIALEYLDKNQTQDELRSLKEKYNFQ